MLFGEIIAVSIIKTHKYKMQNYFFVKATGTDSYHSVLKS
jgi:hypothetical protein